MIAVANPPPRHRGHRPVAPCRHCGRVRSLRPRRLCWMCFYDPAIRALHPPSVSKFAVRGVGNFCGPARLPAEPTAAWPGTTEKIAAMQAREARGEQLFHPADGPGDREVMR